ncbi:MAG: phosphatase PAP2 family protein [Hyphomicrobiales bacterium]
MIDIDLFLTKFINDPAGQHAAVDQFMIWVSSLGVPLLVALVALQWWRRTDRSGVRHVLVACGLSFLLGLGLNQLILLFIHRIRPYDAGVTHLLIPPSADWSLPSDHATATMAIAATFLLHRMPRVGAAFLAASLLMMYARVYVGIHYTGDVLAGAVTGALAAFIVTKLYRQGTRLDRLITGIF